MVKYFIDYTAGWQGEMIRFDQTYPYIFIRLDASVQLMLTPAGLDW